MPSLCSTQRRLLLLLASLDYSTDHLNAPYVPLSRSLIARPRCLTQSITTSPLRPPPAGLTLALAPPLAFPTAVSPLSSLGSSPSSFAPRSLLNSTTAWRLLSRPVLLIGGGSVATGRLFYLLEAGANVTLIAPREGLSPEIAWRIEVEQKRLAEVKEGEKESGRIYWKDRKWEDKDEEGLRGTSSF